MWYTYTIEIYYPLGLIEYKYNKTHFVSFLL